MSVSRCNVCTVCTVKVCDWVSLYCGNVNADYYATYSQEIIRQAKLTSVKQMKNKTESRLTAIFIFAYCLNGLSEIIENRVNILISAI